MAAPHKKNHSLNVSYDPFTDTIYFDTGEDHRNSVGRDIGNGVIVQYSLTKKKIIGATVHDFKKRFKNKEKSFTVESLGITLKSA